MDPTGIHFSSIEPSLRAQQRLHESLVRRPVTIREAVLKLEHRVASLEGIFATLDGALSSLETRASNHLVKSSTSSQTLASDAVSSEELEAKTQQDE